MFKIQTECDQRLVIVSYGTVGIPRSSIFTLKECEAALMHVALAVLSLNLFIKLSHLSI